LSIVSSPLASKKTSWPAIFAAVGLTTSATLMLELSLTRIFSVVFYYHFAFLAISIALFGLGAGGVLSYYVSSHGTQLYRTLGWISALNAGVAVGALVLILSLPASGGFMIFAAVYFAAAAPFVLAGMVVSLAISEAIDRVDKVYFFDLAGAAAGCLLLVPFLNLVGGPGAALAAAVLYAAASAVWFGLSKHSLGRAVGVALALLLVALVLVNKRDSVIDVTHAKGLALADEVFVRWNTFSRVALKENPASGEAIIAIDADATTGIPRFDLDNLTAGQRKELESGGPGFPYRLRPGGKTLIIGSGGGWDVARAIASGSKDVTAVEINPIIANTIMRGRFRALSNGLYFRPEVHVAVEDGRTFVRGSAEKYQLLQATLVDTWASTAAGAFALSENNLYTTGAFHDYLSHLTDDGMLAFTRWGFQPPRESLRLLALARYALSGMGEPEPWRHIFVVRENSAGVSGWGATDTAIIYRKPMSHADIDRALSAAKDGGFEVLYSPDRRLDNPFTQLLRTDAPRDFYGSYAYDVSPVPDDRPFFFYTVQTRDLWSFLRNASHESADYKVNLAVPTLFSLLGISLLATFITLALPPFLLRTRLPREPGVPAFLIYFLCLGAGYILVQVGLIQQLVLFLGHPTYALTTVVFSMLVSSGLGSYFSRRIVKGSDRRLCIGLAAVFACVGLLAFTMRSVTDAAAALPLPLRALLTVLMVAPAGFAMGIPFPSGLTRLELWHHPSIRWAWSLNAAASVLGSCAAIFCAIYLGLRMTLLIGAALYLVALLPVWLTSDRLPRSARPA
jgi:hypothetical protein